MKYLTIINNQEFEIEIDSDGNITVNGEPRHVDFQSLGTSLHSIIMDDKSLQVVVNNDAGDYSVLLGGRLYEGRVFDERALLMAQRRGGLTGGSGELNSPMPGLIVSIAVEIGQSVTSGETCVVLESMKMQNELKAPVDGTIASIHVQVGKTVDKNELLIVISPHDEDE